MKKPGFHTQRLLDAATFPLTSPRMRDIVNCLLWDGRDSEAFEIADFFVNHMTSLRGEEWYIWHGIWIVLLAQRARRASRRNTRALSPKRTKRAVVEAAATVVKPDAQKRSAS